jgi:hypothetical protein
MTPRGQISEPLRIAWALDLRPVDALVVVEPGYSLEVPVSVPLAIDPRGAVDETSLGNGWRPRLWLPRSWGRLARVDLTALVEFVRSLLRGRR